MGIIVGYHCSNCSMNQQFRIGVGMMYPRAYQAAVAAAKNGEYGDILEKFFAEHPDGAIDISDTVVCCQSCGRFENVDDFSMYIPKSDKQEPHHGIWSVALPASDVDYVTPNELKEHYTLYAEYPHKCRKCQEKAQVITEILEKSTEIYCPKCHSRIHFRIHAYTD